MIISVYSRPGRRSVLLASALVTLLVLWLTLVEEVVHGLEIQPMEQEQQQQQPFSNNDTPFRNRIGKNRNRSNGASSNSDIDNQPHHTYLRRMEQELGNEEVYANSLRAQRTTTLLETNTERTARNLSSARNNNISANASTRSRHLGWKDKSSSSPSSSTGRSSSNGGFLQDSHLSGFPYFENTNGGSHTAIKIQQDDNSSSTQSSPITVSINGGMYSGNVQDDEDTTTTTSATTDIAKETRIVGGTTSEKGQFPYFVDLAGCGGSLISPQIVLSAAHCEDAGFSRRGQVRIGAFSSTWAEDDGSMLVDVDRVVIHPGYDKATVANDVMLIRLKQPVSADTIRSTPTLLLEQRADHRSTDKLYTVLGLGSLRESGGFPSSLNHVEVQAFDDDVCMDKYSSRGANIIPDVMFCAGVPEGGKDSCQGDSGGPIVRENGDGTHSQVGIVSWGIGCALAGFPGVYADVPAAMNWIDDVVCDISTGWDRSASFCDNPASITNAPTEPPTPPPTVGATTTPPLVNSPMPTYSAQYVVFMEHYTDDLTPYNNTVNSPTYYPRVRYTCRGDFKMIMKNNDIQMNPNVTCVDYNQDGFTGQECRHLCDDCSYWWNNNGENFGEFWSRAGVWFECSGQTMEDMEAKFVWIDDGNIEIAIPPSIQATNAKLARLAIRNDYSQTTDEILSAGVFPPTDPTFNYQLLTLSNGKPESTDESTDVFLSTTGGFDEGYIAWTGASLCTGDCIVDFGDLVLSSNPRSFPPNFYQINHDIR